jgi:hypothetical protein
VERHWGVTQIYKLSGPTSYHNKMKVLADSRPISPGGQAKFWAWRACRRTRAGDPARRIRCRAPQHGTIFAHGCREDVSLKEPAFTGYHGRNASEVAVVGPTIRVPVGTYIRRLGEAVPCLPRVPASVWREHCTRIRGTCRA